MKNKQPWWLLIVILIGALFRLTGLNWDSDQHLHPDERFLTMVGTQLKIPQPKLDYFQPYISTLNPTNVGFDFFVYGTIPLTITKTLAVIYEHDTYGEFALLGRFISAAFDVLTIYLVYRVAVLLRKKYKLPTKLPYWASFLYAIAVLPIQLSHFLAVDTFLTFFMFASFYYALRYNFEKNIVNLLKSSVFMGLGLATKISALYILPLVIFLLLDFQYLLTCLKKKQIGIYLKTIMSPLTLFFLSTYFCLRIFNPYYFEYAHFFNPTINKRFLDSIRQLNSLSRADIWFPPAVQWMNKPIVTFSLVNTAVFGLGLPYFLGLLAGTLVLIKKVQTKVLQNINLLAIVGWTLAFFIYQSSQFVKAMRYFIFLYPFWSLFAGVGISSFINKIKHPAIKANLTVITIVSLLIWPLMFISIYLYPHPRVTASEWIYNNLEDKSIILTEHWDDGLPLPIKQSTNKTFELDSLPIFDPDIPQKWEEFQEKFSGADYYILSSNRGWGSIPTIPEKYPLMSRFYHDLFADKLGYKRVAEFTSYPSLEYLGIPLTLSDDWADESFTVYDHPKVLIYKNVHK